MSKTPGNSSMNANTQAMFDPSPQPNSAIRVHQLGALSDSSLMFAASTQAVTDSYMLEADTQAISRDNDSPLLGAATQALVGRLGLSTPNTSNILNAETQALHGDINGGNDSPLLGTATQALVGQLGLGTPHSTTNFSLDSPGVMSANSSTDSLLGLATQPVFKLPDTMQTQMFSKLVGNEQTESEVDNCSSSSDGVLEAETETSVTRSKDHYTDEAENHEEAKTKMDDLEVECEKAQHLENLEATQCPESFAELAEELEQRETEFQSNADNEETFTEGAEVEARCPSSTSNVSDNLLEAALDDHDDDMIQADALQRSNSVASNASDNLLEAAAEESEDEMNNDVTEQTRLIAEDDAAGEHQNGKESFTGGDSTNMLEKIGNQEIAEDASIAAELTRTTGDDIQATNEMEEESLSKTTLGSVSMVESSQHTHTLQKAASSIRNRTDYGSLTMDQTEVVDSEILSTEDEETRLVAKGLPIVANADVTDKTLFGVLSNDDADVSAIEGSPIIRRSRPGAHSQSLQTETNSGLSEQLKTRLNCSLPPLAINSRGSNLPQIPRNSGLQSDVGVDESPVFRKRQCNKANLSKMTLSRGEVSQVEGDPEGCLENDAQINKVCEQTVVDCKVSNEADNAPLKYNSDSQQLNISVVRRSSSVHLIEKHDDEVQKVTSSAVRCVIATSVRAEKTDEEREDADSSPILPSTQELSGFEEDGEEILPCSQAEEDPRGSTFYDLIPADDSECQVSVETRKAGVVEAEPNVESDKRSFAVPDPKPDVNSPTVVVKEKEDESSEGRGKRARRLTSKMLESPILSEKKTRISGGNDVKVTGKRNSRRGVIAAEVEAEPEKATKSRPITAKEGLVKKDKPPRASRRIGKAQVKTLTESPSETIEPINKVEAVTVKDNCKDDSVVPRRGKRNCESDAEGKAAKQTRRSNVAEVLASTSTNNQVRSVGKKVEEIAEKSESAEKGEPVKRSSRRTSLAAKKEKLPSEVQEEPKGKLRRGGRKLAGVASLSVMMTESADEEAVAEPTGVALSSKTANVEAPVPKKVNGASVRVVKKTAAEGRRRIKKGEVRVEEVERNQGNSSSESKISPASIKVADVRVPEETVATAILERDGLEKSTEGIGRKSRVSNKLDEERNLETSVKGKSKRGGKVEKPKDIVQSRKTKKGGPSAEENEKAPDTQPLVSEEEVIEASALLRLSAKSASSKAEPRSTAAQSTTDKPNSSTSNKMQTRHHGKPAPSSNSTRGRKRGVKVEADDKDESSSEKRQPSNFSQASTTSLSSSRSRRSEGSRRSEVAASPSLRAAPSTRHAVMFTGFTNESDSALVKDLGGFLTEEVQECTVLVADSMKRTYKLLCTVGRGVPVVGESWLKESRASRRLVDPWLHILKVLFYLIITKQKTMQSSQFFLRNQLRKKS